MVIQLLAAVGISNVSPLLAAQGMVPLTMRRQRQPLPRLRWLFL